GPSEYLYGEETALLEVVDGRHPFPRIDPPYRRGVDELTPDPGSRSAADVTLAAPGGTTEAPPALVDNVEPMANVSGILADTTDLVAVAHGVAHFLAVESCGQCAACKQDGLEMAAILDRLRRSAVGKDDLEELARRVDTVSEGARCYLAYQQQRVVGSLLR